MNFIDKIKERAKINRKKIVLPETMDERVIDAAIKIRDEEIADIILIGTPMKEVDLTGITVIEPEKTELTDQLANELYELRKEKHMTLEEAKHLLLTDYMYYACMLVKMGYADGVVSGACHSTANTLRPSLQIIKTKPGVSLVSAFFLMIVPNCEYGEEGTFVFADSGLEQNPTPSR